MSKCALAALFRTMKGWKAMLTTLVSYYLGLFSISLIQEAEVSDFNDLGSLLLGGFVIAVVVAILLVFIKLRLQDKKPPAAQFTSINSFKE